MPAGDRDHFAAHALALADVAVVRHVMLKKRMGDMRSQALGVRLHRDDSLNFDALKFIAGLEDERGLLAVVAEVDGVDLIFKQIAEKLLVDLRAVQAGR